MPHEFDSRLIGFGIALGLGFIVGLEREWAEGKPIGVRSFVLITIFGGLCALFINDVGPWLVVGGALALSLVLFTTLGDSNIKGMTTVMAALVMYLIGAAAVAGYWVHAIVLGGLASLILHWKKPLHQLVDRLGHGDVETVARFILIGLVVLPVLPDQTFGPLGVFNPFKAWLLVVLIVSINLGGFIAFRLSGAHAGMWLAGVLGGLVSSTATTVSYAGMSKRKQTIAPLAALVILVASTVVYLRVVGELLVVAPNLVGWIVGPSVVFSAFMLAICAIVYRRASRTGDTELPEQTNPAQFKMALTFAAIYVVVLFSVAAARALVGDQAIYAVAIISGLTDVDALTLSVGQLFDEQALPADIAWRAIFLATWANLLFKMLIASFIGSAALRTWILATCTGALVAGGALLWLWPSGFRIL